MDVSSGDLRVPLLVAQKMDEDFYGIFYLLHFIQQKEMGMMGGKEDDMRLRLWVRCKSITLKLQQQLMGNVINFVTEETQIMES